MVNEGGKTMGDKVQTWRVVLRDGSAREVEVVPEGGEWSARWNGNETFLHPSPMCAMRAMLMAYMDEDLDVREILAPGEPTRAELAAEVDRLRAENATLRSMRGER